MADDSEIKGLIALLQGLYSRLAQSVVGMRQASHRKGYAPSSKDDLSDLLSRQVEKLVQSAGGSGETRRPPARIISGEEKEAETPFNPSTESTARPLIVEDPHSGELGSHFHESEVDHFAHSSVGDNIKRRVLEHVNNALRHARSGDRAAAKMALDIARASLAEAAHYMDDAEYGAFTEQVKGQLKKFEE